MGQFMVIPDGKDSESFLELARTPKTKGRLFRKHILSKGTLHYNNKKYEIDDNFLNSLVANFQAKKCDIVQVPIVDDANKHSEDPLRNIGEVIDLKVEDGKLYSYIDSRKADASDELGNTLIGASALVAPNYVDTDTDLPVGPTLLHVAITNRPHVLNLEDFEEIIAASSDGSDEVILLSETSESTESENDTPEETKTMNLEELLATLKTEHDIDVPALQTSLSELSVEKDTLATQVTDLTAERDTLKAEASTAEDLAVKLSNSIKEHLHADETIGLSADAPASAQVETLIGVVAEAGTKITTLTDETVSLSGRIDALEDDKKKTAASTQVDELISAGRILPVNRDAMVELRLSNSELFDKIVPETPIIELSREDGTGEDSKQSADFVQSEVQRLLAN